MILPESSTDCSDVSAIADLLCPPLPIDAHELPIEETEQLRKPPHLLRPFIIGMLILTCVLPLYSLLLLTVPVWNDSIGAWIEAYSETLKTQREASYAALLICQSILLALFFGMIFAPMFQARIPSGIHGELVLLRVHEYSQQHARRQGLSLVVVLISMVMVVYSAVGALGTEKLLQLYGWGLNQNTADKLAQFAWDPWIHPNYFFGHLLLLLLVVVGLVSMGMRHTDRIGDQLDRLERLNVLRADIVKDTEPANRWASWRLWCAVGIFAVTGVVLLVTVESWIFIVLYGAVFLLVAVCSSYAGQVRMWGTQDRRVVYGGVLAIQIVVVLVLIVTAASEVADRATPALVALVVATAVVHFVALLWIAAIRPLLRRADTQLERQAHLVESVRAYRRERSALEGYLRVADDETIHLLITVEAALETQTPVYQAPRAGVAAAAL